MAYDGDDDDGAHTIWIVLVCATKTSVSQFASARNRVKENMFRAVINDDDECRTLIILTVETLISFVHSFIKTSKQKRTRLLSVHVLMWSK